MADEREMEQEKQRSNSLRQARLKVLFPVRKKKNLWSFYACTLYLVQNLMGKPTVYIYMYARL